MLVALVLAFRQALSLAQEMEPRAYSPSPVGMNFVGFSWQNSSGNVATDPTLPISNVESDIDNLMVGYSRTFGLAGRSASAAVVLPYTFADVSGDVFEESRSVERTGQGDVRLRFAINLLGAPALDREQFAQRTPRTTLGASLLVVAPTGEYNSDHLINIGSNRWSFKPELGVYVPRGPWAAEVAGGVWLFTDNHDFFGGSKREQDPMPAVQTNLSYTFRPRLWVSGNATYYWGGKTTVDGKRNADLQKSSRVGLTASFPVARQQSVKVAWSEGMTSRIGADFTTWTIAWQYAW